MKGIMSVSCHLSSYLQIEMHLEHAPDDMILMPGALFLGSINYAHNRHTYILG